MSVRTIKRDLSALQQTGAPIRSQPGPGGGYAIEASASLPPVAFTPSQAVAVAMALAVLPPASPFSVDARAAADKLFDTLGASARSAAEALCGRVWILEPRSAQPPSTPVLRAIERSLVEEVALVIRYRAADGVRTRRAVEPIIAAWAEGHWHLVAHCRERDAIRWFRFERIERADVTRDRYRPRPVADIGNPPADAHSVA